MASAKEIRLKYVAELQQFRADLEKLDGISKSTAKAMEREFIKSLKAIDRESKQRTRKVGDNLKHVEDQAGDADSALQGVAAALRLVNPEAAEAAAVVGDVGGGLEGLIRVGKVSRGVLGPLALAAAAAAAAYLAWSKEQERLKRVQDAHIAVQDQMLTLHRQIEDSTLGLAEATGDLTSEERALMQVRRQAFVESMPALQEMTASITEQGARVADLQRRLKGATDAMQQSTQAQQFGAATARALAADLAEELSQLNALEGARSKMIDQIRELVSVKLEEATATKQLATAEKDLITQKLFHLELDRIRAELAAKNADDIENAVKMRQQAEAEAATAAEMAAAAEAARVESLTLVYAGLAGSVASLSSTAATLFDAAEMSKAAKAAFAIHKALAIAEATVNATLAVSRAAAAAPPPGNIPFIAAAAAFGAAQVATIAATPAPFPMGSFGVGAPPDHGVVSKRPDEAILNSRATSALGRDGVAALNRGASMGPTAVAVPVFTAARRWTRSETRRHGSELRKALRRFSRSGQTGY